MSLDDFQSAISQFIFQQEGSQRATKFIKEYSDDELLARLSIYQNNTFYSLSEALKDLYPTVVDTIGEDLFKQIAKDYLKNNPPQSAAMVDFGHDFPDFIPKVSACESIGYLEDLARLDLYYHLSYHAEDIDCVPAETFSNLEIEKLVTAKIEAIASAMLLASDFAIFDIWQLVHTQQEQSVDADKMQYILVIRPEAEVNIYKLDVGTYIFLKELEAEVNINDALLAAQEADSTFNPSNAISFLIQSGFSARIIEE